MKALASEYFYLLVIRRVLCRRRRRIVNTLDMSPTFVPVYDQETPRSERNDDREFKKHERFHRQFDKSGERFGGCERDRDVAIGTKRIVFREEDAKRTIIEKKFKGKLDGYYFGTVNDVLGYHVDPRREKTTAWRTTWSKTMEERELERVRFLNANDGAKTSDERRKREGADDPNDYRPVKKSIVTTASASTAVEQNNTSAAAALSRAEKERVALERLKQKRTSQQQHEQQRIFAKGNSRQHSFSRRS